jgi:hypothetical protein
MNAQDVEIMRLVRRELAKHPIDTTRMDIQVNLGRVTLGGVVTNVRDQPNIDIKDELAIVDKRLMKDRLIREYANQVRVLQNQEHKEEEGGARGRMRHT